METLARKAGLALWQQIGERLSDEITRGRHEPGTQLPTEPELMQRFGVSRHTVRRAMAELEDKGLIRVEQGRGTFVHEDVVHYRIAKRTRFTHNLVMQGRAPQQKILSVSPQPAAGEVAQALQIDKGVEVYRFETLSYADGIVISCAEDYFPAEIFPNLPDLRRRGLRMQTIYAQYGIQDYIRLVTWISARPPTDEEARLLQQPRSRPVLVTQKIDTDLGGRPVSYGESRWAADRVQFVVDNKDFEPAA